MAKLTVTALQQMKRDGQKIMAAVCYDYQLSRILDRAGVDLISAGDSAGHINLGQRIPGPNFAAMCHQRGLHFDPWCGQERRF